MREIKFRAWDKINKKWMSVEDLDEEIIINPYTSTSRAGQFSLSEWNVVHRVSEDLGTTIILMQFTGLKDKNGKGIWEGDIVRRHYGHPNRELYVEEIKDIRKDIELDPDVVYEVIGNIHENGELLK